MTKNQHFIPQFYQRYWQCERTGYIWALDKRYNNVRQRPIKHNCSSELLYEANKKRPTNLFENFYKEEIENKYGDRFARLIKSRNCLLKITESDKTMICKLFTNFSARNDINLYQNLQNHTLASFFTLGDGIDRTVERRYLLNVIASSGGFFENHLLSYKIQILVSDKPNIIFCDRIVEQVCYPDEYFFPICPYMVALFSRTNDSEDMIVRRILDEEYRRFLELYIISPFTSQLYSQDKAVLDNIKKNYSFTIWKQHFYSAKPLF